jgi:hypothetical protein
MDTIQILKHLVSNLEKETKLFKKMDMDLVYLGFINIYTNETKGLYASQLRSEIFDEGIYYDPHAGFYFYYGEAPIENPYGQKVAFRLNETEMEYLPNEAVLGLKNAAITNQYASGGV